jgi:CMP-N,N'-diacetyllegionaminic acid synthase
MNILGVVPARGGSKRIPNKNLRPLGGIPLLSHCLRTAQQCALIDRLVVSTDSEAIAAAAAGDGVETIERPPALAEDNTPTLPVIQHAVEELAKSGFLADIILTIQPTYPFLRLETLERSIRVFETQQDIDSVTTVCRAPFQFHPYNARKVNQDGTLSFMFLEEKKRCPNSQSAPLVYYFGNLYSSKYETIFHKGSLYGERSYPVEISPIESLDIDDQLDMEMAEWLYGRGLPW